MDDRLISADALEKHCRNTKIIELFPEWKDFPYAMKIALIRYGKAWKEIIQNAPTVDAVEVVHGHWFSLTDCSNAGVYCSVCHKKVWKEDYAWCNRKNKLRSNYCPNCGANMRGSE